MDGENPSAPEMRRCPRCLRAVPAAARERCPLCGRASLRRVWARCTRKHPIQPEETEDRCPRCGKEIVVHPEDRAECGAYLPNYVIAGGAGPAILLLMGYDKPEIGPLLAMILLLSLAPLPVWRVEQRHGAAEVLKSMIVECRGCGWLRIVGDDDSGNAESRFWSGRAAINLVYRAFSAVLAFFLAVAIAGTVMDDHAPPEVIATVGIALIGWLSARTGLTIWYPTRRWWSIGPFGR